MERWRGRAAVVTGASAGIGAAIAYQLQDAGVDVVALARRVDKIEGAIDAARKGAQERGKMQIGKSTSPGKLYTQKCDVSKEEDILNAFKWIKNNVGRVDILVNNAGRAGDTKLLQTNTQEWQEMMSTNVLGLSICTREAVKLMREIDVDDGHIVHIGSVAGYNLPSWPGFSMYHATKHAVRVLTDGLRKELTEAESRIRVTEVSPGLVKTEIDSTLTSMTSDEIWALPYIQAEDIADAVLYALSAPPDVNIFEIVVKPVGEIV